MEGEIYKTGQLLEILGVTRDALRYYEEQGIVQPNQNENNHYREFGDRDIYALLVADFYMKRDLSIKEIKALQSGGSVAEVEALLRTKAEQAEAMIRNVQCRLQHMRETLAFCQAIQAGLNRFSLKAFPVYEVLGAFSDFYSFVEYPALLKHKDQQTEDLLSKMLRVYTFDAEGIQESEMYIVEACEAMRHDPKGKRFEYATCMYTIVEDRRYESEQDDLKPSLLESALAWGAEHGWNPIGKALVRTRLITYLDQEERAYQEIYLPVEQL